MTDLSYILPEAADPQQQATALAADLTVESDGCAAFRRRYFDSFDWRVHRANLALVHEDRCWRLRRLVGDEIVVEAPAGEGPWPRFAGDFPAAGGLRKRLAKLLKMRAVIHLVTVVGERRTWRALNADRKTVLRLELTALRTEKPATDRELRAVTLIPVRGYDGPAERARQDAAARGLAPLDRPLLDAVLEAAGFAARGYSSRFRAELTPGQTSLEAAVCVSRALLTTMRRNEAGVRQDVDTEFLHDFRVAVRRQRSALTIFKDVFDAEAVEVFKRELTALGRLTGPLRDLDVYLLDEKRYRGLLPAALRPGLDPLFVDLRAQRECALAEVRQALDLPAYRELTAAWDAFLADPRPGSQAQRPVLDLARDRLGHRHGRVVHRGRAIGARSPDTALHRLRIECKKLRYLLEFFASLFAEDDGAALVAQLKGLQDNLGEFNDLCVQQRMLQAALAGIAPDRRGALPEAAALGGLITALGTRQRAVRGAFEAAFAAFDGPEPARRFERLMDDTGEVSA